MLVVETIARIRREHFIKGKTIKEIARDLKVSRNTVRKVLRSGETSFEYERLVQPRPKLGRWASELDGLLAVNAAKSAREQLTLIRIFEELRGRGYDGGYDAVRRYARRWSKERGQSTAAASRSGADFLIRSVEMSGASCAGCQPARPRIMLSRSQQASWYHPTAICNNHDGRGSSISRALLSPAVLRQPRTFQLSWRA